MVYKIKYSKLAIKTLDQNLLYLINNSLENSALKFINKVGEIVFLIAKNPKLYALWNSKLNIRKVVIVSQITMFYKINENTIDIVLFWNNYQNLNKLNELLNI